MGLYFNKILPVTRCVYGREGGRAYVGSLQAQDQMGCLLREWEGPVCDTKQEALDALDMEKALEAFHSDGFEDGRK